MAKCISPVELSHKSPRVTNHSRYFQVPCGRCTPCVRSYRGQWVFRLQEEIKVSSSAYFLTLTYSDEHLPYKEIEIETFEDAPSTYYVSHLPTLDYTHHQKFLKKLRKKLDTLELPNKIRYYGCGEYGEKYGRPHFHYIIFNLPSELASKEALTNIWKKGHVDISEVNEARIHYVAGYVDKKLEKPREDKLDNYLQAGERSFMSKGIGASYLTEARKEYYRRKEVPYIIAENGTKRVMPRYYRDKLYDAEAQRRIVKTVRAYLEEIAPKTEKEQLEEIARINHLHRMQEIKKIKRASHALL